jgi:D-alanyl-D-alanine carboxypeptidase/D-alanyl-D-alanine-endopeptidase (penicillin-binding protein 4)
MTQATEYESFMESLPVSGRDGTLSYRMSKDGMQGRVFAKTGTLRDVSALSGYLHRADGRKIAFSMVSNHFSTRTASIRGAQDRICGILYRTDLP